MRVLWRGTCLVEAGGPSDSGPSFLGLSLADRLGGVMVGAFIVARAQETIRKPGTYLGPRVLLTPGVVDPRRVFLRLKATFPLV